jgi:glutaredoxin 2
MKKLAKFSFIYIYICSILIASIGVSSAIIYFSAKKETYTLSIGKYKQFLNKNKSYIVNDQSTIDKYNS